MRRWRALTVAVLALVACPSGRATGQDAGAAGPAGPPLKLGALVPLNGPGSWFATEIKQGLELAAAELDPKSRRSPGLPGVAPSAPTTPGSASTTAPPQETPLEEPADDSRPSWSNTGSIGGPPDGSAAADGGADPTTPGAEAPKPLPPAEPVEAPDRPRTVTLSVQALDVSPIDLRAAENEMSRLLGAGVAAVLTVSPTPTATVLPMAASRDVLVIHAGLPSSRLSPATSRLFLQLRPAPGARAEVLAAYAWERGIRRLAILAGGDEFGKAVRAGASARWRKLGGVPTHEESLFLDASDRRSRLRAVARTGPEAIVLGYDGAALGEAARALRGVGYTGLILGADDDRAAMLAGGPAMDGALLMSDAFVPIPGTRGARFARAYFARHAQPPSRFAASAYEIAVLLADVARPDRAGGRQSGHRLREALRAGKRPSLYAGDVTVLADGTLARPLALFRVEKGRLAFEGYFDQDGRLVVGPPAAEIGVAPALPPALLPASPPASPIR